MLTHTRVSSASPCSTRSIPLSPRTRSVRELGSNDASPSSRPALALVSRRHCPSPASCSRAQGERVWRRTVRASWADRALAAGHGGRDAHAPVLRKKGPAASKLRKDRGAGTGKRRACYGAGRRASACPSRRSRVFLKRTRRTCNVGSGQVRRFSKVLSNRPVDPAAERHAALRGTHSGGAGYRERQPARATRCRLHSKMASMSPTTSRM